VVDAAMQEACGMGTLRFGEPLDRLRHRCQRTLDGGGAVASPPYRRIQTGLH
jgi:hypothetical protein